MSTRITPEKIRSLLKEKGEKQKVLCDILSISSPNVSNIMNGRRKISASEEKLLRLYFYGEIPFDMMRQQEQLGSMLKFSSQEWAIIGVLRIKEGYVSEQAWITAKIRAFLENSEQGLAAKRELSTTNNIIDPVKHADDADAQAKDQRSAG